MKLPRRRQFLHLAAGAAALPLVAHREGGSLSVAAGALDRRVPRRRPSDILARLIGTIAVRAAWPAIRHREPPRRWRQHRDRSRRNAPADGYTLLLIGSSNTINPSLYDKLNFDFLRDIVPVAGIVRVPLVMVVTLIPVKTVPDFIAYAKANPGKVNVASLSGTVTHVAIELFKMRTGIDMVHVPYRGSAPMVPDLIGGQVQAAIDNLPTSIEHIKSRRLKALAVTTAVRSLALPDVPTVGEFLPNFEASRAQP